MVRGVTRAGASFPTPLFVLAAQPVVDALVVASAAAGSGPAKVASSDGSHVPKLIAAARLRREAPIGWVPV